MYILIWLLHVYMYIRTCITQGVFYHLKQALCKLGTGLLYYAYFIFYLLCYAPVLKFLTYYAQYYAHVKDLCLNLIVLLEYIHLYKINVVTVLLEYI